MIESGGPGNGGVSSWNDLTDKPFGSEIVEILPETTVDIDPEQGMGIIPAEFTLEVGKEYVIMYNGVEYCVSNGIEAGGQFIIGNTGALDESLPITAEPFCLAYGVIDSDETGTDILGWLLMPIDGSASATLSIKGEVVTQIPTKYIPSQYFVMDVDFGESSSAQIDMDTTELVDAILNYLPIYVNYRVYDDFNNKTIVGRQIAFPSTMEDFGDDFPLTRIEDAISAYLLYGIDKSRMLLSLSFFVDGEEKTIVINRPTE